ncbi:MAG: PAS domain S-box protein [Chloroflexaceae bacterium]
MTTHVQNSNGTANEIAFLQGRIADLERQLQDQQDIEQELRGQVELYRQTLDALPDMVLIKGLQSRILYANKAFRDCYGMSMEQLRDLIDAPFVDPDYTQQYVKDDEYVFTHEQPLQIAEEITRHDGTLLSVETSKLPVFNAAGQVAQVVAVIRDVGERKRLENELDHFFDLSLDMFCVAGMDGYFKRLNPAWSRTLGYTEEELLAEPFLNFVHPDDREMTIAAAGQTQQGLDVAAFENRYRCKDGAYKWIEWKSATFPEQHIIYAVARDITERKQVERELGENERRLTQFLDGLPVGVFVIDPNGRPFYANQTAQEILGKGILPTEGVGDLAEVYDAYLAGTDTLYPTEQLPIVRAIRGEKVVIDDMEVHQPGRVIPLEVTGIPINDTNGHLAYAMIAFTDITERKAAEATLRQTISQEEIIRAQAATLRELSTPLIPINDQVMVMPLIGTIDSYRTQQVMDSLLQGIAANHAQIAIIDITGVPVVDSQVADALVRAARAVRLLGARVVLTGIRPEVAQTLVGLGIDLSGIVTRGSLQSGIAYALEPQ